MNTYRRHPGTYPLTIVVVGLALAAYAAIMLTYPRHVDIEARNAEPVPGSKAGPLWDADEEVYDLFSLEPIGPARDFPEAD